MALSPGMVTMNTIRTMAANRASIPLPNLTSFIPTPVFNQMIFDSAEELYDLLTDTYEDYYVSPQPYPIITTNGSSSQYPLPADFFKLSGVNLLVAAAPSGRLTLKRFNMIDRNRWNTLLGGVVNGVWSFMRYCAFGTPAMLWLVPEPPAGNQQIEVMYTPRMKALADAGTIVVNGLANPSFATNAGRQVTVSCSLSVFQVNTSTASAGYIYLVGSQQFTCVTGAAGVAQFNAGATDAGTAQNLAASITSFFAGSTTLISATADGVNPVAKITWTFTAALSPVGGTQFALPFGAGATDITASQNLATVMAAQGTLNNALTCTADGINPQVNVALTPNALVNGQLISWSASPEFALTPNQASWTNVLDSIQGWYEYVVLDMALKIRTQQQQDASDFALQKQAMKERIQSTASNRDEGQAWTVSDTARIGGVFGDEGYGQGDML